MNIFITDDLKIYSESKEQNKLLFENYVFTQSSFIETNELNQFNSSLNFIEFKAQEFMLVELYSYIQKSGINEKSFNVNKYLCTRSKEDIAFTLLYNDFNKFVTAKYLLKIVIEKLIPLFQISVIKIYFSELYNLLSEKDFIEFPYIKFSIEYYKSLSKTASSFKKAAKNLGYTLINLKNKYLQKFSSSFRTENKTHILLLLHKSQKELDLLGKLFELIANDSKSCLTVILLHTLHDADFYKKIKQLKSLNIRFFEITDFRDSITIKHEDFYEYIKMDFPSFQNFNTIYQKLEIFYSWIGHAFNIIKPDVCLYAKIDEPGRVLSDVARYNNVPSVNLEYSFTFDSCGIENNISFTTKALISEATKAIWIKRKDPSLHHEIIGYCKFDSISNIDSGKNNFFIDNELGDANKTILFASTWGGDYYSYDIEKATIIKHLSEMCHRNNWNLIIKKHPSEKDLIADEILKKNKYPKQKIFTHNEIKLSEAIFYSDILCTQSSSVVLEALLFSKPFCYLSLTNENNVPKIMPLKFEPGIKSFSDMNLFENYLFDIFTLRYNKELLELITSLKRKYLFNTDSRASERLLTLLKNLAAKS